MPVLLRAPASLRSAQCMLPVLAPWSAHSMPCSSWSLCFKPASPFALYDTCALSVDIGVLPKRHSYAWVAGRAEQPLFVILSAVQVAALAIAARADCPSSVLRPNLTHARQHAAKVVQKTPSVIPLQ